MVLRSFARIRETNLEKQRARLVSFEDFQLDIIPTTPRFRSKLFLQHRPMLVLTIFFQNTVPMAGKVITCSVTRRRPGSGRA